MYHPQGRNANNTNDQDVHTSQQMQLMNHPENLAFFAQQPQQQMSVVNTAGFNDFSQLMDPMSIAAAFSSRYTNNNFSQDPLMGGNNGNFMMPPQSELTNSQYPFDLSSALPIANTPAPSTSTNNHQNQQPQTAQKGYKATPRRITLNAQQQLTTIHFFYDQYPEDTYTDEDLFKLSQSCGLEFELTKRRMANLNGKQRDLRNSLFNTKAGMDYEFILELIAKLDQQSDNESGNCKGSSPSSSSSSSSSLRRQKKSRVTLSVNTGLFQNQLLTDNNHQSSTTTPSSFFLTGNEELSGRKRAGKDDKLLIELHHRELLGIGLVLSHCYVMGQSKMVKDWLAQKRSEVQEWLVNHFGPSKAIRLVDPCRPYYTPTTPAELLDF